MVWKFLELIQFLVSSNQPQHQQLDWTVAVGMDKPRKAGEKERGGIFEAGGWRAGQYFGGNRGRRGSGEHERSGQPAHIR